MSHRAAKLPASSSLDPGDEAKDHVLSLALPGRNSSYATAREELFKVKQGVPLTAGR